jgi:hypothetical protein
LVKLLEAFCTKDPSHAAIWCNLQTGIFGRVVDPQLLAFVLDKWDHDSNPFRAMWNLAVRIADNEQHHISRLSVAGWRRDDPTEWALHMQVRWNEVTNVYFAAIQAADRTGLSVKDVEQRLNALRQPVEAILLWQRDAPRLTTEDRQMIELSGVVNDPASDYFLRHYHRMVEAYREIEVLIARFDGQANGADDAGNLGEPEGSQKVEAEAPAFKAGDDQEVAKRYLISWAEILTAIDRKNDEATRGLIRRFSDEHDGPIIFPGQGAQPKVDKKKLIDWWNHLEAVWETQANPNGADETVANSHPYGKTAEVIPEIGGSIKRRREKK